MQNNSYSFRIREERERLGFSQTEFAAMGGASLRSQQSWEKESAFPNIKMLQAWADQGADILYIVTGQHLSKAEQVEEQVHQAYQWVFKFADKLNAREHLTADLAKELAKEIYEFLQDDEMSASNILDFVGRFEQKLRAA
ncbi:hypothetical protein [Agarivorans sp. QJM3NY_25]|uniref:helix-turn-helix domain-containing protein n=1 Tax=Agarivorans sp. QJM3NY_25 TaxID=3421430 RepID=UPI003D7C8C52